MGGLILLYNTFYVCNGEEVIRIISSRKATEKERRDYYEKRV